MIIRQKILISAILFVIMALIPSHPREITILLIVIGEYIGINLIIIGFRGLFCYPTSVSRARFFNI